MIICFETYRSSRARLPTMSLLRAALGSLRAQGLRAAASLPSASSLWAARAFVFAAPPPPARAAPLQPQPLLQQLLQRLQPEPQLALVGLESPPPAPLAAAAAALADAFSILTMNRNKRECVPRWRAACAQLLARSHSHNSASHLLALPASGPGRPTTARAPAAACAASASTTRAPTSTPTSPPPSSCARRTSTISWLRAGGRASRDPCIASNIKENGPAPRQALLFRK